ncbi:hypothetical protein ACKYVA_22230, partial [Paenibacillus larvae]|uniref:hypothetical protein n=1 Tax=Paenibacillus larvae TaxID=1464 RepID=UPI00390817F6
PLAPAAMASTLDLDKGCTVEELLRGCIEAFAIPEGQLQLGSVTFADLFFRGGVYGEKSRVDELVQIPRPGKTSLG